MLKQSKKAFKRILVILLVLSISLPSSYAFTYETDSNKVLYEYKEKKIITKGIEYEHVRQLTPVGWLDYNMLMVDLNEPTLELTNLRSTEKFGKKDQLTDLMNQNQAVAGINGDFFITHRNPTDTIGPEIKDSTVISAYDNDYRIENGQNTLFLSENGDFIFDILESQYSWVNKDGKGFEVQSKNKITNIYGPSYFDSNSMKDTTQIDSLNPNMVKYIVINNRITYKSKPGEKVTIPENGYIIAIEDSMGHELYKNFLVGEAVSFNEDYNVDINRIKLGISGGGKILSKGKIPDSLGLAISPKSRHPRSAIGLSKNGNKLYMLAVDGRNYSIGANIYDLANIMMSYGVYEAIHLDGGGSTTIGGRTPETGKVSVLNDPSDGGQRAVVNGIGVISHGKSDQVMNLEILAPKERTFINNEITFDIRGYDAYYNRLDIPKDEVKWIARATKGQWNNATFIPNTSGEVEIVALYNGYVARKTITVMEEPLILDIEPKMIEISPGGEQEINLVGIDKDGYSSKVNSDLVQWVFDPQLGVMENGKFYANDVIGSGEIKGKIGDTEVKGYIVIGDNQQVVEDFEGQDDNLEGSSYPEYVEVQTDYLTRETYQGKRAIGMGYKFLGGTKETQAAYINFKDAIQIQGEPIALGAYIFGDKSGHWLRGKITDASGKSFNIDFSYSIDWFGWSYIKANIPFNVQYPIQLDRIYVTSLNKQEDLQSAILVDNIMAHYSLLETEQKENIMMALKRPAYKDHLNQPIDDTKGDVISIFGSTSGKNSLLDYLLQKQVIQKLNDESDMIVLAGETDVDESLLKKTHMIWKDQYETQETEDTLLINLGTSKHGIRLTAPEQWLKLRNTLDTTDKKHVIIMMNQNPLDRYGFHDQMEGQAFHETLKSYKETRDMDIFVINASGYYTNVDITEGIRYITINGLWYKMKDDYLDLCENFNILNFQVIDGQLRYEFVPVYSRVQ